MLEFAHEVASLVEHKNRENFRANFLEKYENLWTPVTHVNFGKEFIEEELIFWSQAFRYVSHLLYNRKIGQSGSAEWQPLFIAYAWNISDMLADYANIRLAFTPPYKQLGL